MAFGEILNILGTKKCLCTQLLGRFCLFVNSFPFYLNFIYGFEFDFVCNGTNRKEDIFREILFYFIRIIFLFSTGESIFLA